MKRIVALIMLISLFISVSFLTACGKGIPTKGFEEPISYVPLIIENFSFEIPSYWTENERKGDIIRYYAEVDEKVAMLTISYKIDDEDSVTWKLLCDEKELMATAIETSMESVGCKVTGCEEVVSDYGEKGLLYNYTLSFDIGDECLPGKGAWYCLPSEEDNRWFFINYAITENVEYENYENDFWGLIASAKCNHGISEENENTANSEFIVTMSEEELKGLMTVEAEEKLKNMGFDRFQYQSIETDDSDKADGTVAAVEIKKWKFGKGDFSRGDSYNKDAIVVIWTYSYKEPENQQPVFYSTNTYDIAKEGKTGAFSYKNKSGEYDIYWIVDFDDGYVYYFTEGNGESTCDKVRIISGDLNDKVVVEWNDHGTKWSYRLHFEYINHPETLIVNDHNGFKTEFEATGLEQAEAIREKKTIRNY